MISTSESEVAIENTDKYYIRISQISTWLSKQKPYDSNMSNQHDPSFMPLHSLTLDTCNTCTVINKTKTDLIESEILKKKKKEEIFQAG